MIAIGKVDAIGGNITSHTLWLFSIAMENDPFMMICHDIPCIRGDFP